jgi:hypothetical protein
MDTMTDPTANLLTLAAAAKRIGVDASTLRWQIRHKRLAAVKFGRDWYVDPTEADRYRDENRRRLAPISETELRAQHGDR